MDAVFDRALRRERVFRDRANPLEFGDDEIVRKFRLPRREIMNLIDLLSEDLEPQSNRNNPVPVALQVCAALRFYASGSFQAALGDSCGLSQPTLSRIITKFTEALTRRVNQFISFPVDEAARRRTSQAFYALHGFPNVIGVIDGTHIAIKAPTRNEHLYGNRKTFHSLNVQLVCDANCIILDIVAKWPGSCHDAFILENSAICQLFQGGQLLNGWLLGKEDLMPFRFPYSQLLYIHS